METTAKEIEAYLEQSLKDLEENLEKTGETPRQTRRKRRQRIKQFVTSSPRNVKDVLVWENKN